MVSRTWRNLLLTALGMGVLAGAGQLGIAFSFGIVQLTSAPTGATVNQWPAQLVWVGWFAAHAAVAGTLVTARLARRYGVLGNTGRLVAVAATAALGATVVVPLCIRPAQAAGSFSVDPILAVGICATLGALVGAGAAIAAVVKPPLGWNMAVVGGVVWLLALVSIVPSLATAGPLPAVRLGVLEPAGLDAGAAHRQAILILPAVALLIGAATGGLARWRGHPPLVSGATGMAGMVLVAFVYLTAGPGDAVDRYQITPYYGALLAVAAGVFGSVAAALLRWPLLPRTDEARVVEPADVLRPLSAGPATPQAMTLAAGGTTDEPAPDLAGAGALAGASAAKLSTAAEPMGFGAPAGDREASAVPAASTTRTAAPADLDHTPETSAPAPATAAHLPAGSGGDRYGTAEAEADNTEPDGTPADGALVAPGTRRMYQPPKTDRTPVQPTWQVVPARRVPPSIEPAPDARATHSAGTQEKPEPALPPRNRPPLPNLNRAENWEALATAQRAGPPSTIDAAPAGPVVPAPAAPASVVEAGRAGGRGGLFRRNKSRADREGAGSPADGEPLPRQDAEFVDWVTRLGKPAAGNEADQESHHRSLHSTGRQHSD
ncbi:hypothetical protein GA0070607_4847 [Micromonospora coriariae]|uniref:Uncharacterized protein n=1 Tax=Micromonospora coriariae TaxID=285665 RepID=A0A1C4X8T3_9ACTN|nr:hypothetical protein [Micromonospora coriariae]SCF04777.1 hypothetical protein GA0070607_4847 [Micromonospora coriariae]